MQRLLNRRRSSQQGLPLSSIDPTVPDGSGKSVHMESPIIRSIKSASSFTKFTYAWLFLSLVSIFLGWKIIRYKYASIDIICNSKKCTLKIFPPGRGKYLSVGFMRDQLLSSEVTFIDIHGHEKRPSINQLEEENKIKPLMNPPDRPDADGYYESFAVIIAEHSPIESIYNTGHNSTQEWQQLIQATYVTQEENGNFRVIVRRFNLGHTFKRVQSQMSKVYTYVKKRREQLHVEEPTNISWQGILLMTFGAMSTLISIALGQFWESDEDDYGVFGASSANKRGKKTTSKNIHSSSYRGNVAVHNGLGSRPNSFAYTYTGYPNMKYY